MEIKVTSSEKLVDVFLTLLNIVISSIMFLPIYNDNAVLPGYDSFGNQIAISATYPRTPYSRLAGLGIDWMVYFVFVLVAVSLFLLAVYYLKKQFGLYKLKTIVLTTSSLLFIILISLAAIQIAQY